jgi:hypothetical protein
MLIETLISKFSYDCRRDCSRGACLSLNPRQDCSAGGSFRSPCSFKICVTVKQNIYISFFVTRNFSCPCVLSRRKHGPSSGHKVTSIRMYGIANPSISQPTFEVAAWNNKRICVVGGTNGIGRALALAAAKQGCSVTVVGRTFRDDGVDNISFVKLDAGSLSECVRVSQQLDAAWDLLVFTHGIVAPKVREITKDGLEVDMAISAFRYSTLIVICSVLPLAFNFLF